MIIMVIRKRSQPACTRVKIAKKTPTLVQRKLVRPWPDWPDRFRRPCKDMVHSSVAYVRQDDRLIAQLTVRETLEFVAALRLAATMPWSEKAAHVESVVQELALWHVIDQRVGSVEKRGISGGERRRVSIGVQILLNQQLLLLDEPTSGLDAFTAMQLIELLQQLSRSGRIVVMTVHQPRAAIFRQFDKLLLLSAGGRTVYCGHGNTSVLEYFDTIGCSCPKLSNPADYLLDLATVDLHSEAEETQSRNRVSQLASKFRGRCTEQQTVMWQGGSVTHHESSTSSSLSAKGQSQANQPAQKTPRISLPTGKTATAFQQFLILCWRTWLMEFRNVGWQLHQLFAALWMTLELGIVYYSISLDQRGIRDRLSLLYVGVALYPFNITLDTISRLHSQRRHFYYEIEDGMYGTLPMFLSKLVCELPFNLIGWLCYVSIFYWMAGLKGDIASFMESALLILLIAYVARSAAMAIASAIHSFQVGGVTMSDLFEAWLTIRECLSQPLRHFPLLLQ